MAPRIATVSSGIVRLALEYAARAGLASPDPSAARGAERMTVGEFEALWGRLSARAADPALALHIGEAIAAGMSGHVLYAVMLNCATLGAALERFCRYHGLLVDGAGPQWRDEGAVRVYSLDESPGIGERFSDAILALLTATIVRVSSGRSRPVEVRFTRPQPPDVTEHQRVLGAPMVFACGENGIVIARADLDFPITAADPALLSWLERFARAKLERGSGPRGWADRASCAISACLLSGAPPFVGSIARELGASPRRLQRELASEGSSFREILGEERARMAREMLERGETELHEIAFLLGFSEQSAFNRAFKRWTGRSPLAYMRSLAKRP